MIYHNLLATCRRWMPELMPIIQAAAVFHTDMIPHQALSKNWNEAFAKSVSEHFRLPYAITCIEDAATCTILAEHNPRPGTATERLFVDCTPYIPTVSSRAYSDDIDKKQMVNEVLKRFPSDAVTVSFGRFSSVTKSGVEFRVRGIVDSVLLASPTQLLLKTDDVNPHDPLGADTTAAALKNAMTALEEIIHFHSLPGFSGWPQDNRIVTDIFEIARTGRVSVSDQFTRDL